MVTSSSSSSVTFPALMHIGGGGQAAQTARTAATVADAAS